jgi:hypothetical protein
MRQAPPRHPAADDEIDPAVLEAMEHFGITPIAPDEEPEPELLLDQLEVCPGNERALTLFLACQRHWRLVLGGMGGVYWSAVPPGDVRQVMDWQGIQRKEQGELWQQYTLMEQEGLAILNRREAEAARQN